MEPARRRAAPPGKRVPPPSAAAAPGLPPAAPASPRPSSSGVCLGVGTLLSLFPRPSGPVANALLSLPPRPPALNPALPCVRLPGRRRVGLGLGAVAPPVLPVRPVPHACSTSLPAACSSAAGHGGSAGCSTAPGSPSRRAAVAGDAAQGMCCRGQF